MTFILTSENHARQILPEGIVTGRNGISRENTKVHQDDMLYHVFSDFNGQTI